MYDVPSELFREILLRLPAELLFRLRSVCKTWLHIIDDPSFIKAHTNNQLYNHTLLVRNQTGAQIYSFSLDSLNFISLPQQVDATCIKQLIRKDVPRLRDLFNVAFCNGLILLSNAPFCNIKKTWAIWNPLTMDCHELPRPDGVLCMGGFGFGYDGDANDYKVVRIDRVDRVFSETGRQTVYQTLVYSLKSDSWSIIEDCPDPFQLVSPGVFLNGVLYWRSMGMIIALDLRAESYCQFPLPQTPLFADCRLDALDRCLIYSSSIYNMMHFDGWVMKEDEDEKVWIKLFSLRGRVFDVGPDFKLVAYLKSKRQVVLQHEQGFLWFDVDNNSVKKFSIHGVPRITSSQICPGSLVRLSVRGSGGVAEKTLTRKRKMKSKKRDTRLKICVLDVEYECSSDNCFCSEDMCIHCSLGEERYW